MAQIEYAIRDRAAWLRINRPEARNACSVAMLTELQDRVYAAQVDPDVHTLVLTGNGNLTSGFDLKEVPIDSGREAIRLHFRRASLYWHSILHALARLRKPVVVGASGHNIAAAIGLIAVADFTIATDDCRVTPGWISIGICPDASSTYHLPRIIGLRRASEWIMTNRTVDARELREWGLVSEVVPRAELDAALLRRVKALGAVPAELLGWTKFLMHHGTTATIEEQTEWERDGVVESVGSEFMIERLREFLGKKKPSVREVVAGREG